MILGKSLTYSQPGNEPAKAFLFRKRVEKIDWRRIASVDVNRVASQIDIETLQEILTPVTFCDITSEIDTRYVDTNFIKLFQLAQLLIEYLLSITQLQDQLVQKSNRLTMVRRECHRRRLLLLAQQQLMDSGPQSYHRCLYCSKAFLNASFLAAHVHRRHPETELPTATKPVTEVGFVQTDPRPTIAANDGFQTQNNNTSAALEKDVRELLSHLRSQQFQGPPNVELPALDTQNTPYPPLVNTGTGRGDEAQKDWQATMREERRRELDLLRSTFEKELKEIQAQYTSTRQELYQLKLKKATSNLGELLDDDSDESQPKRGSLKRNPDPAVREPEMRKEIIAPAGLSSERLGPDLPQGKNRQYVQVLDEPTMVTDTKSSPCQPHTMSSPTVHPSDSRKHAEMQHSAQPLSVSRQSEDLTVESDEMEVSRVMGRALASSGTPTPIHSPNVNMTRHDRLLDQLQPDAETLRRLRHEIEQLLNEQLAAHNIGKDQTQLSTPQLNERLAKLKRERERLSQKYPDFMEIREALAQQVDRMANAALHSRSTNRLNASGSGKGAKNVQLGPSGLPPPAVHSPASIRKYGTIPLSSQRTDLHSPMGYSMPSLMGQGRSRAGQSGSSSLNSSLYKLNTSGLPEAKPRFQRSSPQLNFDNEYSEEPIHSPQQSETSIREVSRASPKKTAQSPKHPLKSPERKTRLDGGGSPSINFSPDHRVVTFGTKSDVNPNFVASSSDEWDSDSDDIKAPTESNREAGNQHKTAPRTGLDDRLTDDMDDDLDAVENYLNSEGRQRNANALRNPEQPVRLLSSHPADPKMGIADYFSPSAIPGDPTFRNSTTAVSRSLDPSVAAAHATSAALGPRPVTRYGNSGRQASSGNFNSVGSPDFSNTLATSLWGSNSKGISLSTNVNTALKSDNALEDLDTDE
ncbi:unnamed protein product [Calicophoron daubneyi]|uniref:C2H2-type domain-containing protein n=1 Tax=Calicophoron daubneyi TaxID=300641 RepID=A0AAV2TKK2_CALDB